MHMVNSPTAKLSLVVARKKTLDVAEKLKTASNQEAFELLWELAWKDLRDLEDFRCPCNEPSEE